MTSTAIESVLQFWFGSNPDDAVVAKEKSALWWSKNPHMDDEIRQRFETLVKKADADELADWQATSQGRLALILLTDQFPRSIYRDSARAFAYDARALAWCLDGLQQSVDRELRPIQRVFFYLPLEHAESLDHQDEAVRQFRQLLDDVGTNEKDVFEEYLKFAISHRDIIARFGRFPHRNKILGRESTPEELLFLKQPGSSF